jgi:tetrahydromethanopterin S-methyltransferase subunit A
VIDEQPSKRETKVPVIHRIMSLMGRLMPFDEQGENAAAVRMFYRMDAILDLVKTAPLRLLRSRRKAHVWPITSGAYKVGDHKAPIAICTLTSNDLMERLAKLPRVAISGRVYTVNLGIEKIILNITANPSIRFLLLCGKESAVFHPGQALLALANDGVTSERRIIGARGHLPVLSNVSMDRIALFRRQVQLIDRIGETDVEALATAVRDLGARDPGQFKERVGDVELELVTNESSRFVNLHPGGRRQPLAYDPKGFFVITLDRPAGEIVLRHYLPDNAPAHEMRGRSAETMLLGLLRKDLISQLSHAGYLGAELAKAEAALSLELYYDQDRPLRLPMETV